MMCCVKHNRIIKVNKMILKSFSTCRNAPSVPHAYYIGTLLFCTIYNNYWRHQTIIFYLPLYYTGQLFYVKPSLFLCWIIVILSSYNAYITLDWNCFLRFTIYQKFILNIKYNINLGTKCITSVPMLWCYYWCHWINYECRLKIKLCRYF